MLKKRWIPPLLVIGLLLGIQAAQRCQEPLLSA